MKFEEFTLEQKIFIVQSFYINNMDVDLVREEFQMRFQIETAESILDTFREIVETFEATGTTAETQFFYELVSP